VTLYIAKVLFLQANSRFVYIERSYKDPVEFTRGKESIGIDVV